MYINKFLLASHTIATLKAIKNELAKKYNVKDLRKVTTIIGWQIIRDLIA